MIALVSGMLVSRDGETITVETSGGVGYTLTVPAGTMARLPAVGQAVRLHTELVVREDGWMLFGFDEPADRAVFRRLLGASGFGPRLALGLLAELGAERAVRAIRTRDLAVLSSVSGIGRKKAERLALELSDRFDDLELAVAPAPARGSDEAVRALVALGYTPAAADDAVRLAARDVALEDTPQLIRRALARLAGARPGRTP
jgi:Holliday junction DNA helicase RuvA